MEKPQRLGGPQAAARQKPEGGFCFIPAMALIGAWWAYKRGIIELLDLRVWLACFELTTRRCGVSGGRRPAYRVEEIGGLVAGVDLPKSRAALRRLQAACLLSWSASAIRFGNGVSNLTGTAREDVERGVRQVANVQRKVPVPRRMLRFLCRCRRPVLIATVLGHLLRCLYYRNGLCRPNGRCKASWIAAVFAVDERNVKAARRELRELGWLVVEDASQTLLNRFGAVVRINLAWNEPRAAGERKRPPPPRVERLVSPPPDSYGKLSRSDNQKPLQTVPLVFPNRPPTWKHLVPADLRDPARTELLWQQAQARGLCPPGEGARLAFFGAAAHALRVGTSNPCGLFAVLVRRRLWSFITAADEDIARRAAAHARWPRTPSPPRRAPPDGRPVAAGTVASRLVRELVRRAGGLRGVSGRGFPAARGPAAVAHPGRAERAGDGRRGAMGAR